MRTHTSDFKTNISTFGREISATICYYTTEAYYNLVTENGDYLTTENGDYLVTEKGYLTVDNEYIYNIKYGFSTDLFKTVMPYLQFDVSYSIPKNTQVCFKLGVKVGTTYEYLDYGYFYIYDTPNYNADTKSYTHIAFSKMIDSMIKYSSEPLTVSYPISHKNLLIAIFNKLNWSYNLPTYANEDVLINEDLYSTIADITYRDILDDLCPATVGNLLFDKDEILQLKTITETSDIIDDEFMSSVNVALGKKYGPVNSLVLSRSEDSDNIYRRDDSSITTNGLTEYKIKNNILLSSEDREDFIQNMFDDLNGLEYYLCDYKSTGICYYEPLDRYTISNNSISYTTIMLNDEQNITQGLNENIYIKEPQETVTDYSTSSPTDKDIKNAVIIANKNNAEIVLKVNSDGKIAQVKLGTNADDGTEITIQADQVNLTATDVINLLSGNEINLASKNITIKSDNFNVDASGNLTCTGATLTGGILKIGTKEIFNTSGVLTLLQFPSASGDTPLGWFWDGTNIINEAINIAYIIPSNFVVVNAYVSVYHIPCYTNTSGGYKWGYSRAVKLYTLNNTGLYFEKTFGTISLPQYGEMTSSEVYTDGTSTNAFGSSGFTADVANATTHNAQTVKSGNISTRFTANTSGMLIVKSSSIRPTTDVQVAEQTGQGFATLNIIGYYKI